MTRFALAGVFAVLVAASRPVATGGAHDFIAVGAVVADATAPGGTRLHLAAPTAETIAAYDALLRTPARAALLQGTTVHAGAPGAGDAPLALVFYGHRSRAGKAVVSFTGDQPLAATGTALEAARTVASLTPAVTATAARVLLESPDTGALADALETLAVVRADVAAAEALRIAGDGRGDTTRRLIAVKTLRALGGPAQFPGAFARLAADADPAIAAAAR